MVSLQCLHVNAGKMRESRSNWRFVCAAGLQSCLHHRNTVEKLLWLECCNGWTQTLFKGQAGTERRTLVNGKEQQGHTEDRWSTFWEFMVRIRGQTTVGSIVVDVCYKLPEQ